MAVKPLKITFKKLYQNVETFGSFTPALDTLVNLLVRNFTLCSLP